MKIIVLMFDSLRRDMLSAYGNQETITPNFKRIEKKATTFDNCFVGGLPCMPARRDLQTGRLNFMHRSWGPMEPFDNSVPEILKQNGIHSHLVTDHKHYWREGGATYHPKFSTYELVRGQEGDAWKGIVNAPQAANNFNEPTSFFARKSKSRNQDIINRQYMEKEKDHPLARTVGLGIEFMEANKDANSWYLQIECFDPHEPFFVPQKYLDMYGVNEEFDGWPPYYYNNVDGKLTKTIQNYYKALLTMCDAYVGKVLDKMDELDLWEDTMLIINTDHGFLLGEHEWWGKNIMPLYNEIANIPLFVYDPRSKKSGRRKALVQNIDVAATILEFFNIERPKEMLGKPVRKVIEGEDYLHDSVVFGYFGGNINISDGNYIYMHAPINQDQQLNEYTLMPTHMSSMFSVKELQNLELEKPFSFTKNLKTMKIPTANLIGSNYSRFGSRLYAIDDKKQLNKIDDPNIEYDMLVKLKEKMILNDAPQELYVFYGLDKKLTLTDITEQKNSIKKQNMLISEKIEFVDNNTLEGYLTFVKIMKNPELAKLFEVSEKVDQQFLIKTINQVVPKSKINEVMYQVNLNMRLD